MTSDDFFPSLERRVAAGMAREYFCAYHSYIEAMEQLNDTEKGRLFTACLIYSKTGEAPRLSGTSALCFLA